MCASRLDWSRWTEFCREGQYLLLTFSVLSVIGLSGCNEVEFSQVSKQGGKTIASGRATITVTEQAAVQEEVGIVELRGNALSPGATVRLMAMNPTSGESVELASAVSDPVAQSVFSNFGLELYPYRVEFQPTDLVGTDLWPVGGVAYLTIDDGSSDAVSVVSELNVDEAANDGVAAQEAARQMDPFGQFDVANSDKNSQGPGVTMPSVARADSSFKIANFTTLVDLDVRAPDPDLQFLTYKYTDPEDNTVGQPQRRRGLSNRELQDMSDHGDDYYEAIGAFREYVVKEFDIQRDTERELRLDKSSLQNFKRLHGWNDDEIPVAVFYNGGDFGLGRRVRCMNKSDKIDIPMPPDVDVEPQRRRTEVINDPVAVICISENFGSVDDPVSINQALNEAVNLRNQPFASVAMEYMENADGNTPNAIKFYVYNFDGSILPLAILDSEGEKHFPEICTVCHGGQYDLVTRAITGSSYLPLAIPEFDYSDRNGFRLADQMSVMRYINDIIDAAGSTPTAVKSYISAQRSAPMEQMTRATGEHGPIPIGWQDRPELYEKVFAPYCRACHQTSKLLPFETSASFVAFGAVIVDSVCVRYTMPAAERTFANFWDSDARGVLLRELGVMNPCAPARANNNNNNNNNNQFQFGNNN